MREAKQKERKKKCKRKKPKKQLIQSKMYSDLSIIQKAKC